MRTQLKHDTTGEWPLYSTSSSTVRVTLLVASRVRRMRGEVKVASQRRPRESNLSSI
jgi:hypothetical protein